MLSPQWLVPRHQRSLRFLGIIPFMRRRWKIGARSECVRITIIGDVAEFVGHSVACNHAASDVG